MNFNQEQISLQTGTSLSHKERVRKALLHQPIDHLPTQINYTSRMGEILASHWHLQMDELPQFLDNHLIRVDLNLEGINKPKEAIRFDWWGAGHSTSEEGYFIAHSPLAEKKDLDSVFWPEPHAPGLLDDASEVIKEYGQEFFILPNFGWALFERAWSLRGYEQLMMDLVLDPGYVEELLDRIVNIQLVLIDRFLGLGVDGCYFGDDYGAQNRLLFSPNTWRKMIKPRLQRMFAPFIERGLPVVMHSDGAIELILPDLVEIGLTCLNPIQPEVLDHCTLRSQYNERLSYYGGISTQTVLPHGDPDEVGDAIQSCIQTLAPDGTGLWIAPSHRLMSDIPVRNIEALLAGFRMISS